MTDAALMALLRPHVSRILAASKPAPVPATFAAGPPTAPNPDARRAMFYAAAGFSGDDVDRFADYFSADDEGHYPGDVHRYFGLGVKEFADRSHLVRKQITRKDGHKSWVWVNPDKGKHAGKDDTPTRHPDEHPTHEAETAVAHAINAPHELTADHIERLAAHLDTLPRDRLRDLARQSQVTMGRLKADLVAHLLEHVRGQRNPAAAPGAALERGDPVTRRWKLDAPKPKAGVGQYEAWKQAAAGGGVNDGRRDAGSAAGGSGDDVADGTGGGGAVRGGGDAGGVRGVGRPEAGSGGVGDPLADGRTEDELRAAVRGKTKGLAAVESGAKAVGVEGRGGKDMADAAQRGMYTSTVNGTPIYAKTAEAAKPLEDYLRGGGKYGTPEFSRLLGYSPEEVNEYKQMLAAGGDPGGLLTHDEMRATGGGATEPAPAPAAPPTPNPFARPTPPERTSTKGDTFAPHSDPTAEKGSFISGRDGLHPVTGFGPDGTPRTASEPAQTHTQHGQVFEKDGIPRVYAATIKNGRGDVSFAQAESREDLRQAAGTLAAAGLDPAEHLGHAAAHTFGTGTRSMLSRVHEYLKAGGLELPESPSAAPSAADPDPEPGDEPEPEHVGTHAASGLDFAVAGDRVHVSGNTRTHAASLKRAGFKWVPPEEWEEDVPMAPGAKLGGGYWEGTLDHAVNLGVPRAHDIPDLLGVKTKSKIGGGRVVTGVARPAAPPTAATKVANSGNSGNAGIDSPQQKLDTAPVAQPPAPGGGGGGGGKMTTQEKLDALSGHKAAGVWGMKTVLEAADKAASPEARDAAIVSSLQYIYRQSSAAEKTKLAEIMASMGVPVPPSLSSLHAVADRVKSLGVAHKTDVDYDRGVVHIKVVDAKSGNTVTEPITDTSDEGIRAAAARATVEMKKRQRESAARKRAEQEANRS